MDTAAAEGNGNGSGPLVKDAATQTTKDAVKTDKEEVEPAAVEVWHAKDIDVMPRQKINARADRQRNFLSAWHVETGKFVQLSKDPTEQVTPIKHQKLAYAANWTSYAMDRTIGRPTADLYLIDLATGDRTRLLGRRLRAAAGEQ